MDWTLAPIVHQWLGRRDTPCTPRLYRSVSTIRAAIGATVAVIVFVVSAVLPGKAQVVGYIFTPFFLLVAWRLWTGGIRTERGGVKVVRFFQTRHVAWDDIDHFAVLPLGNYPWVGHVVLRNGHRLPRLAIAAAARPRTERRRLQVQRPIDELNQALEDRRKAAKQQIEGSAS